MVTRSRGYAPPSAIGRAAVSFVLLIGFYLVLLGFAGFLFAAPIAFAMFIKRFNWFTAMFFLFAWTPAVLLLKSAFTTRRPTFVPPPRLLEASEAPGLFAMVDELARQARTAPPSEIYLDWVPTLSVTEVGRVWRTRRVMIVGAPLVGFLTVDELRAGVAHELGHFIGGDTRLTTFTTQTHALFASVLESVKRNPFRQGTSHFAIEAGLGFAQALGSALVVLYGRLFLRVTLPIDRRQELAADALSAEIVGAPVAASALEHVSTYSPLYLEYLSSDVSYAVRKGAMPTDLTAGFERLRERFLSGARGRAFVEEVKTKATDPYDTHPALVDRLRAIEAYPKSAGTEDDRPSSVLFRDPDALDAWLVQATRERLIAAVSSEHGKVPKLRDLSWANVAVEAFTPALREDARRIAATLHPLFPETTTLGGMFRSVLKAVDDGAVIEVAARVEPRVRGIPPGEVAEAARAVAHMTLGTLFQGALLEIGAVVEDSLGSPSLILRLGEERVDALELVREFARDPRSRPELERWAERVEPPRGC